MINLHKITLKSKKNPSTWIFVILLLFPVLSIKAQVRAGDVEYKTLGIRFSIPQGWKGRETAEGFVIGHDSEPGMIILSTHQYKTLEQIKEEAQHGFQDENGTSLQVTGNFNPVGENGIGALYQGMMQWTQVKLYAIGLTNPHGYGLTIMAGTSDDLYTDKYKRLAESVAASVRFSKPETGPIVDQWKQHLTGKRLTYMDSYYSSSPGIDGMEGGGYSSEETIDLCPQGYFNFSSSSDVSVDTGGAYGFGASSGQGNGTWEITGNVNGGATLLLNFNNGKVNEYELTYEDEKTMLNGYRYYITDGSYSDDQAPKCY